MINLRSIRVMLLAIALWLALAPPAAASIVVNLDSITPSVSPAGFRWRYSVDITSTDGFSGFNQNDFFTIYDLPGTVVTVEAPPLWGASGHLTGITPGGLNPTDDATISNITFAYIDASNRPGNDAVLPNTFFDIFLSVDTPVSSQVSWQDYLTYPIGDGQLHSGLGTVVIENNDGSVPLPGTLALLGIGLVGLAAWRRRAH